LTAFSNAEFNEMLKPWIPSLYPSRDENQPYTVSAKKKQEQEKNRKKQAGKGTETGEVFS